MFEGNSQVLDHILVSGALFARPLDFDVVHVNAEFADQASDHDPSVVRVRLNDAPTVSAGGPYSRRRGLDARPDGDGAAIPRAAPLTYAWDLDGNGSFETPGQSVGFSRRRRARQRRWFSVQATDDTGQTATDHGDGDRAQRPADGDLHRTCVELRGLPVHAVAERRPTIRRRPTLRRASVRVRLRRVRLRRLRLVVRDRDCPTDDVGTRTVGAQIRDKDGGVTEYRGTVPVDVTFDSLCALCAASRAGRRTRTRSAPSSAEPQQCADRRCQGRRS